MKELILLIGVSGSGKSTYIKNNFKKEIVVCPDDLRRHFTGSVSDHSQESRVWSYVPKLLKKNLEQYGSAVLDATNVDSKNRASILNNFDRNDVKRIAVIFDVDPEEAKKRVNADIAAGVDRSQVPEDIIDKQYIKFKRGYNTIKQQFDEIKYADKGDNIVKKEDVEKIKKMIFAEMSQLKEEDAAEAQERAQYQSYQDMYLVPQSHWKLKKYANMYDANGNLYRGKLGEVHKLQTVEYDFMHTGEVVTECGDETYSLDAQDFRECFEMANDEEGLKVNNESVINEKKIIKNIKIILHKFGIKEDIKKLSKVKNYFGKTIQESIERLEKQFLREFEYEDSGGSMQDPEEDENQQNRKWTRVIPKFYYNDDFDEIELLTLIYNDSSENVAVSGRKDKDAGGRVLTFQLANGNSIEIAIPAREIEFAASGLLEKELIEYDSEGGANYYYLTEKGKQFCKQHKLYDRLRAVLDNMREIDDSL